MTTNLLKLIALVMILATLSAALMVWPALDTLQKWSVSIYVALIFFCWSYLTWRLLTFHKRLFNYLRLLLAGDYETGIRTPVRLSDELSGVETLANRFVERLRTYDRLRAERVALLARTLELTLKYASDAFIIADSEKEFFSFNPRAQKRLDITRKSFSFDSVLTIKDNRLFADLFKNATQGRKVNAAGSCLLLLPGMKSPVTLNLLLLPMRNRDEDVRYVLIMIDPPPPETEEAETSDDTTLTPPPVVPETEEEDHPAHTVAAEVNPGT